VIRAVAAAMAASLVVAAQASAAPVVVSSPLELARAAASDHGTVLVRAGTYPRVTLQDRHAPVTFRAYGHERPTIRGVTAVGSSGFAFSGFRFSDEVDLTGVSHCSFTNDVSQLRPNGTQTLSGYVVTGVSDAVWRGNTVSNGFIGIHFRFDGVRRVRIEKNRFVRLGGQGIHLQEGQDVRIAHNTFAGILPRADMDPAAHADAVQSTGPSRDVVFDGNLVTGGRGFLILFAPGDSGLRAGHVGTVVQNNLFTGRDFAIRAFSAPGIRIVNNTAWGTQAGPGSGIDLRSPDGANLPTTDALLRNNVVKRLDVSPDTTYESDHNLIVTGPLKGGHNSRRAPRFRHSPRDWRLAPGSPGRGAGTRSGAPRRDRRGRGRGAHPDLGSEQS
jgi:hypothetical protein